MITINIPRRIGTSTRLIDAYIQELFTKGKIKVKDVVPNSTQADRELFDKIFRRLELEHPRMKLDAKQKELTIEIGGIKPASN